MNNGVVTLRTFAKLFKCQPVFHCKTFVDTAHDLADRFGNVLTRFAAEFTHTLGNVSVRNKLGSVRVNEALERLCGKRKLFEVGIGIFLALPLPLAAALLDEPKSDYVLEEACRTVKTALVRDVYVH